MSYIVEGLRQSSAFYHGFFPVSYFYMIFALMGSDLIGHYEIVPAGILVSGFSEAFGDKVLHFTYLGVLYLV